MQWRRSARARTLVIDGSPATVRTESTLGSASARGLALSRAPSVESHLVTFARREKRGDRGRFGRTRRRSA